MEYQHHFALHVQRSGVGLAKENVAADWSVGFAVPAPGSGGRQLVLCAALAAAGLAADAMLDNEVASAVLYVAVVAVSAWMPGGRSTLGAGVVTSVLTLIGLGLLPAGGELWKVVANRLLTLFAIWVTAALVWHHKRLTARHDLAQQRAVRSEQHFRATIESSPSGMLLVDREGRIALVNREAERLFGYAREELLGQPLETLVPQVAREAHAMQRAAFVAEAGSRRMGIGREVTGVDKQGREMPLEVGLAHIDTPDGVFALATVVDVSVRKQLEQSLARTLVEAEELQRKHIAREIHDALGQALTALKLDIGWLAKQLSDGQSELHQRAAEMEELAAGAIEEVRRLSAALRPPILDDQGLLAAIRWQVSDFEKRSGLRCRLALPEAEIPWDTERCTVAFRVLQESLSNVVHHANAKAVGVTLWHEGQGDGLLEVSDDGCGIDTERAARPGALGLISMRERALLQGGTLTVTGIPGAGTTVLLRMPCRPSEPVAVAPLSPAQDAAIAQAAEERG